MDYKRDETYTMKNICCKYHKPTPQAIMTLPSYAQATSASIGKATRPSNQTKESSPGSIPKTPKQKQPPTSIPKKLKRPSTLTPKRRETIAYTSTLSPITPKDPSKPCPLASLPSELRTQIYTHIFAANSHIPQPRSITLKCTGRTTYVFPPLLHISHAIRIEAAYTYYTTQPFHFPVYNLNFQPIRTWIGLLPPAHRALLSLNRSMCIDVAPELQHMFRYPPKGWLLDDTLENHWRACSPVGNIYAVCKASTLRELFILYCRLIIWFRVNASKPYRDIRWRYEFHVRGLRGFWEKKTPGSVLCRFLRDQVGELMVVWGNGAVREGVDGRCREEARVFLDCLDEEFQGLREGCGERIEEIWKREMRLLSSNIERWV